MLLMLPAVVPDRQIFSRALVIVFQLGHQSLIAQVQWVGILPVEVRHFVEAINHIFIADLDGAFAPTVETSGREVDGTDDSAHVVGSINLSPGSFDSRRECAIEVRDEDVVDRLHEVTHADWKNSHPLDLSDEGLLAELEDYDQSAAEDLAIGNHVSEHKKH